MKVIEYIFTQAATEIITTPTPVKNGFLPEWFDEFLQILFCVGIVMALVLVFFYCLIKVIRKASE